jgi:very-long-chain enoyl-CoA reductase
MRDRRTAIGRGARGRARGDRSIARAKRARARGRTAAPQRAARIPGQDAAAARAARGPIGRPPRNPNQPRLSLFLQATVDDLKTAFAAAKPSFYPSRQRFTLPVEPGVKAKPVALAVGKKLSDFGVGDGSVLVFKDLGPQIGYSTVFFWEYFGPMLAYAAVYFLPSVFYPWCPTKKVPAKGDVQKLALAYWTFHYAKRIFETFFVHRYRRGREGNGGKEGEKTKLTLSFFFFSFSHGTMPVTNLYKNCAYYWGFAAYVSYFVNHPHYTAPPTTAAAALLALALVCQACNARAHVLLANLRPVGKATGYAIPRGFPFDGVRVTCANYTFEIYGWILFALATRTFAAALFIGAGAAQMAVWAGAKHARLRKIFDGKNGVEKYPKRWIMLPPFF